MSPKKDGWLRIFKILSAIIAGIKGREFSSASRNNVDMLWYYYGRGSQSQCGAEQGVGPTFPNKDG